MTELRFSFDVPASVEAVIEALTDFSPRRPEIWPDLDPSVYRVLELHETSALVREGQRLPKLWALEEYDWSEPATVRWTARESNFCAPGSFMSVRVEPSGGGSRLDVTWDRTGTILKGKAIVALVRMSRGRPLAKSYAAALSRLGAAP
jgi:hypothetical protein